jgi:hypothetical protein
LTNLNFIQRLNLMLSAFSKAIHYADYWGIT